VARRALYDRQSAYKQAMEQLAAGKKCREADERADQQRQIYGNVVLVLAGSDTLTNTGTIHGNAALGASDTIDNSGGAITAPGKSVWITLPLYTQLVATVAPKEPNQFAEWWQGQNLQIFLSQTATPPLAYKNYYTKTARTNQKTLTSDAPKDLQTFPTCIDPATEKSCPLTFVTDTEGTLPKYAPSQLFEATLGATQVQKVVNDSLPISLNVKNSDFDVSYVNVAYFAGAMGPVDNDQSGYVGSPLVYSDITEGVNTTLGFKSKLEKFQKKFSWPQFIDLDGTKAPIPKLPSTLELMARLNGADAPADISPVISEADWKSGKFWQPIQDLKNNWTAFTDPKKCTHSPEKFTTFCDAILDAKALIDANYEQYKKIYPTKCGASATPVKETEALTLAHVYGWTPWIESGTGPKDCIKPTDNLLENTPHYPDNKYDLYAKVKLEFDKLNYGTYTDTPSYAFNPWVQFIHGSGLQSDQLGMPGVYAYSVDDAVGNLNVAATGYIVDIEGVANLENDTPAGPPLNIQLGFGEQGPNFVTYRVACKPNSPAREVNPANPQFIVNALNPEKCPVYLTDNKNPPQTYTFKVTSPPPQPPLVPPNEAWKDAIIPQDVPDFSKEAVWSTGNGNPTKYNTVRMIDCLGNAVDPAKGFYTSSRVWCCHNNTVGGIGVRAYSTQQVPPAAHQLMQNVVGTIQAKTDPNSTEDFCNMGMKQ
jgi:hypothetical protein